MMKKKRAVNACRVLLAGLMIPACGAAVTLQQNNFDGNDGNDTGPGFKIISLNSPQNTDLMDAAIGVVSFSAPSGLRPNVTLVSDGSVDASTYGSFTVTWNVGSIASTNFSIQKNGLFLGVQTANNDAWNNITSLGIGIRSSAGTNDLDLIGSNSGTKIHESALVGTLTDASIMDGFTATLTVNSDNTWSASTTGLSTDADAGGVLANVTYSQLAGTLFAGTALQLNKDQGLHTITYDEVSVSAEGTGTPVPSSLLLTPDDRLDILLEAPATAATGAVEVTFSYGTDSNNVQITAADVVEEQHAGAFSVVGFSAPLVLTDPASGETLNIQFDLAGTGLADGESSTGLVELVWNEGGGDTFTNTLPVSATYHAPPAALVLDGPVDMVFEAPATGVAQDLAVTFSADSVNPVNAEITDVVFTDKTHEGFSCLTVPPTLTLSTSVPDGALTMAFDNTVAGLNEGETAIATALVIWNEAGLAGIHTNTVVVSAYYYKEVEAGTVLYNNFDGSGINDIGPAFKITSINNPQNMDRTDASTGVMSFSAPADSRPNVTLISEAALDVGGYVGFTITWNLDSIASTNLSLSKNGLFLGVQNDDSDAWNQVTSLGLSVKSDVGDGDLGLAWAKDSAKGFESTLLSTNVLTAESITNGFTATLAVSNDNSWTVSTAGLNTNVNASGTLTNVTYSELAGSLFASAAFQLDKNESLHTLTYGSVTVIAIPGPPAPATLALTPSDQLALEVETPDTLATGAVEVAFTYGGASNPVEIASASVIDQQHAGAFRFVGLSLPLELSDPAIRESLNVEFDLTGTGLSDGASSTGLIQIVWNEIGGGTFTNTLPVSATYLGPESFPNMLLGGFDENTGALKQDARAVTNVTVTLSGFGSASSLGSTDGLWGLSNLGRPDADTTGGAIRGAVNPDLTLVIENTSAEENLTLDTIHFQASRKWGAATNTTLTYVSGDLTDAYGDLASTGAGGYQKFKGYEFDLKTLLLDRMLGPSERAKFKLTFTGNEGTAFVQVDNVAVSGIIGSQPATPAVLEISLGVGGDLGISGSNLTASAAYTLQGATDLVLSNWYDIATTTGVIAVEWNYPSTNEVEFLRVVSP